MDPVLKTQEYANHIVCLQSRWALDLKIFRIPLDKNVAANLQYHAEVLLPSFHQVID